MIRPNQYILERHYPTPSLRQCFELFALDISICRNSLLSASQRYLTLNGHWFSTAIQWDFHIPMSCTKSPIYSQFELESDSPLIFICNSYGHSPFTPFCLVIMIIRLLIPCFSLLIWLCFETKSIKIIFVPYGNLELVLEIFIHILTQWVEFEIFYQVGLNANNIEKYVWVMVNKYDYPFIFSFKKDMLALFLSFLLYNSEILLKLLLHLLILILRWFE